jgi:hypothetical protein
VCAIAGGRPSALAPLAHLLGTAGPEPQPSAAQAPRGSAGPAGAVLDEREAGRSLRAPNDVAAVDPGMAAFPAACALRRDPCGLRHRERNVRMSPREEGGAGVYSSRPFGAITFDARTSGALTEAPGLAKI